jgi:two-component system, NtrC family, response regulator AtoC
VRSLLLALTSIRNAETRSLVRIALEGAGHRVVESGGWAQAQCLLKNGLHPDLFVLEATTSDVSDLARGLECIRANAMGSVCLVTRDGSTRLREEVSAFGIQHFLTMPASLEDVDVILSEMAERVAAQGTTEERSAPFQSNGWSTLGAISDMPPLPYIEELGEGRFFLAACSRMQEIHRQVKLLANVDVNVLILGESGTGKEVIAHLIHKYSQRSQGKFLNVNCAALPAELLESELFGHRQGAFTGAIRDRSGKFEQANRGTILLDEIGETTVQMQAKLLHVLQDGEFTRLGGQEPTKVDVRVLAATNVHMDTALHTKTFREDLYYRLNEFTIKVPSLRERREEIPYLIEEMLRRTPAEMKSGGEAGFASRLIDVALLYDWPGNLRELRNFVTRTIIMRDPDATVRELEARIASNSIQEPIVASLPHRSGMRSVVRDLKDRTEARMILEALETCGWNRRRAAQFLNISYRALLYKIQQHRLAPVPVREVQTRAQASYSA